MTDSPQPEGMLAFQLMDRFKDGDQVKVTGSSRRSGELGTVKGQSQGYEEFYWVAFNDSSVDLYTADSLEAAFCDDTKEN